MVRPNTLTRQLSITGINYYVYWSQLVQARLSGDDMLFDWTNLGIMVFVVILCPLLYLCTNTLALLFQEKIVKGIAIVFFGSLIFPLMVRPSFVLGYPSRTALHKRKIVQTETQNRSNRNTKSISYLNCKLT